MKFTLSWLKSHLETSATLAEICDRLTAIGLEVESLDDKGAALRPFVIAEIREAIRHPEATKLQICRVFDGIEEHQVICGAANARAGLKVVMAPIGTVIPNGGLVIQKAKIRGIESCGMLCSEEELGMADESEGILELPANAPVGQHYAAWAGLDDAVIEINLTPNRSDCTGVRGVARDLAASGIGSLKPMEIPAIEAKSTHPIQVTIAPGAHACRQFLGRAILNVKNGPSPAWLQQRLKAVGQRPISALVDITNYLSLDLGRPAHVYDLDKLKGHITARTAKTGESFLALNGKDYALDESHSVIADDSGVLGAAGIIGGEESGCTEETTNVFLEIAYFDPAHIAMAGRALQIDSDARYRFERGVDPDFLPDAESIASKLILDLCGGEPAARVTAGQSAFTPRVIAFDPSMIKSLGGVELPEEKAKSILEKLGFDVNLTSQWNVTVPSWRRDVEGQADLVEEVVRIHGYQHIPATDLPPVPVTALPGLPLPLERAGKARDVLATRGLLEAYSFSFLHQPVAELFGGGQKELQLLNPISSELGTMRPSLLPNLLDMVRRNIERGFDHIGLCEVGLIFASPAPEGQSTMAAGVRSGPYVDASPHAESREADLFDAKADALAVLEAAGAPVASLQLSRNVPAWYHPGRSGVLSLGKQVLAVFGELHPATLKKMDIKQRVVAFEVMLDAIPAPRRATTTKPAYKVNDLQPVQRDYSFILPETSFSGLLITAIEKSDKERVADASILSCYQDATLKGQGIVSVALRVTYQPQAATFTDADIDALSKAAIQAALTVPGCRMSPALEAFVKQKGIAVI
jgi:phenylalanyl-tRNA synthetase beta chain